MLLQGDNYNLIYPIYTNIFQSQDKCSITNTESTPAVKPPTGPVKTPGDESDAPKRKRGRPRSVTSTSASIDPSDKGWFCKGDT